MDPINPRCVDVCDPNLGFEKNNRCIKCDTSCKKCSNDPKECTKCPDNFYLDLIKKECVGEDFCGKGKYADKNFKECRDCDTTCDECKNNKDNCTSCK